MRGHLCSVNGATSDNDSNDMLSMAGLPRSDAPAFRAAAGPTTALPMGRRPRLAR